MAKAKLVQLKPKQEVIEQKELQIQETEKFVDDKLYNDMLVGVAKLCGSKSKEFGKMITKQLSQCSSPQMDYISILESIEGLKPKNHIESMLVAQMLATHNLTMRCFRRTSSMFDSEAWNAVEIGNDTLNVANKLMRTYSMQMEVLNRYRGKGQQKMIVEHVHINSGGKAIIGNINSTKEVKIQEDGKGEVE